MDQKQNLQQDQTEEESLAERRTKGDAARAKEYAEAAVETNAFREANFELTVGKPHLYMGLEEENDKVILSMFSWNRILADITLDDGEVDELIAGLQAMKARR